MSSTAQPAAEPLRLREAIAFRFTTPLGVAAARELVRDVPRSLAHADFLSRLMLEPGEPPLVSAVLPVNAALFGGRELPFVSELRHTAAGARLAPTPFAPDGRGWAEVGGEATVSGAGPAEPENAGAEPRTAVGSVVEYSLAVTINLRLPSADRWGTRALGKMIELTATSVLRGLVERFPAAVERAAAEAAATEAAGAGVTGTSGAVDASA